MTDLKREKLEISLTNSAPILAVEFCFLVNLQNVIFYVVMLEL